MMVSTGFPRFSTNCAHCNNELTVPEWTEHRNERQIRLRYMAADQKGYNRQKAFDDALIKLNLFEFSNFGPPSNVFMSQLSEAGYAIKGFSLNKENI